MSILRFFSSFGCFLAAGYLGSYLGSEGTTIMTSGRNIVLFGILIFAFLFLFRRYCLQLKKKYGFLLVFILYLSIPFFISFFSFFLRIYLFSRLGLHLGYPFSFILSVGGGQALPLPAQRARPRGRRDTRLIGVFFRNRKGGHVGEFFDPWGGARWGRTFPPTTILSSPA